MHASQSHFRQPQGRNRLAADKLSLCCVVLSVTPSAPRFPVQTRTCVRAIFTDHRSPNLGLMFLLSTCAQRFGPALRATRAAYAKGMDPFAGSLRFFLTLHPNERGTGVEREKFRGAEFDDHEAAVLVRGFGRRFRQELALPERLPLRIAALLRRLDDADGVVSRAERG